MMPAVKLFQYFKYVQRICFTLLLFFCNYSFVFAQHTTIPHGSFEEYVLDRFTIKIEDSLHYHTATKPYSRKTAINLIETHFVNKQFIALYDRNSYNRDFIIDENFPSHINTSLHSGKLFKYFYKENDALYSVQTSAFYLKINPVLHNEFGYSTDASTLRFKNTRGVEITGEIDQKVGFYFYATDNQSQLPLYVQKRVTQGFSILPGEGSTKPFKETGIDYLSAKGYVGFNFTKHISGQFGQDKIFIGDGIRSLIWSNNAKDFLFFKLNTNIWKINYQNMFTELANFKPINVNDGLIEKKYAALHHLSIDVTKHLNVGLFESVVFDRIDSLGNNSGFELQYLNPIIFYRSVESGLGSPDNVLLGLNWKYDFLNQFSLYGQFVLDEFIASELIQFSGWWGNKNAIQVGLKYIDAFKIHFLDLQLEFNAVRPYTYSYEDNGSSYTHYNQAIAHPLGANFKEGIVRIWYQLKPKVYVQNHFIYAIYGSDTASSNWGGNIFADYNTFEQAFENTIAQGVQNDLMLNDFVLSWQFWHNAFLEGRIIYRINDAELNQFDTDEIYFSIGIRMNEVLKFNAY